MSKKKNGQEEMKMESVEQQHPWWVTLVESHSGFDLDETLTRIPTGSVRRLVVLARRLEEQKPAVPTPGEATSLDGVVEVRTAAEAFLRHRPELPPEVVEVRFEMVSGMAMATGVLALAAKVRVPEVAAEALALSNAVFGGGLKVSHMTPEEAVVEVEGVEALLADPALAARLAVFVPPAVMAAVFDAKGRLKAALRKRQSSALPIGRPMVIALLRRRMRAYVRNVAATVDEGNAASVKRAEAALQPIAWFQEAVRSRATEDVVEEEADDEDDATLPLPAEVSPTSE